MIYTNPHTKVVVPADHAANLLLVSKLIAIEKLRVQLEDEDGQKDDIRLLTIEANLIAFKVDMLCES